MMECRTWVQNHLSSEDDHPGKVTVLGVLSCCWLRLPPQTQSIKFTASSQMHWAKNRFKPASCSFKEYIPSLYEPQIFWHTCRSTLLYFMFYSIMHFGLTYLTHLWYTAVRTDVISSASLNFSLNVFCWENPSLKGIWLLSETIIILK